MLGTIASITGVTLLGLWQSCGPEALAVLPVLLVTGLLGVGVVALVYAAISVCWRCLLRPLGGAVSVGLGALAGAVGAYIAFNVLFLLIAVARCTEVSF